MNSTPKPPAPGALVRLAAAFYAGVLGLAALVSWASGHPLWFRSAESRGAGIDWVVDPLVGIAAAAVLIGLSILLERHTEMGRALAGALGALLGPLRVRDCLVLAALSGVAEEALFRGALQPLVGLVAASALFGLAHFAPRRDLRPWAILTFAAGLALGALHDWTGNLVAPIVAHAAINAVNLRRLAQRSGEAG